MKQLHAWRWLWIAAGVLLVALIGAAYVVLRFDSLAQRYLAGGTTVWGLHACCLTVFAGVAGCWTWLTTGSARRHLAIAGAWLVGGILVCQLAPTTNRIFFDEHIYMQIGQSITYTGRADLSLYARVEQGQFFGQLSVVNKQPNGLPYFLSWFFYWFGVSERVADCLNPLLTGVTAAALYGILALAPWRLPAGAAWMGPLLYLLTPLVPWWGRTVSTETGASATMTLAVLAALGFAMRSQRATVNGEWTSALLLAGLTATATYFRPESLMVFPLVVAVLYSVRRDFYRDPAAWGALALAVALTLTNLLHLWSVHTEDWGATDGRRFDFAFLDKNLESNVGYFLTGRWFPLAGTLLFFVGFGWLLRRDWRAGLLWMFWFSLAWGTFVFFYAGGYHYGASSRYAIISAVPVAALAGVGLAAAWNWLNRWPVALGALLCGLVINWGYSFSYVPYKGQEAFEAMADVDFVREQAGKLPPGSLVVSQLNAVWNMQGRSSTQYSNIQPMLDAQLRELVNQYPGGVYFHWSYWENADEPRARLAAKLLAAMDAPEVARMSCLGYTFALYRLDTPAAMQRFGGEEPEHPVVRPYAMDSALHQARIERAIQLNLFKPRDTGAPAP